MAQFVVKCSSHWYVLYLHRRTIDIDASNPVEMEFKAGPQLSFLSPAGIHNAVGLKKAQVWATVSESVNWKAEIRELPRELTAEMS